MRSYLQLSELLEPVIKIILKKGGCLDCIDNDICDKHGHDRKYDDDDKTKKLNSIIQQSKKRKDKLIL